MQQHHETNKLGANQSMRVFNTTNGKATSVLAAEVSQVHLPHTYMWPTQVSSNVVCLASSVAML